MTLPLAARLCGVALAGACLSQGAAAVAFYDPALDTLPSSQGWTTSKPASSVDGISNGVFRLATSAAEAQPTSYGKFFALDTASGFSLDFDLKVVSETHDSPNRAGFSLIVIGSNPAHSIEIGFWQDRVFAYAYDANDPDRFVHGVEKLFDTSSASHEYTLAVQNQQFSLSSAGSTLITGDLVDYRAQGFPYTVPGLIVFGDDTSRGSSSIELGLPLSPVPEPASWALMGLGAMLVAARRRR